MSANSRVALFGRVARTPQLRRIYLAFAGFSVCEHGTWLAVVLYAHREGGAATVGVVAALQLLPSVVLTPFSAYAGDRFRPRRVLAAGYAVQSVSMAATALAMAADRPYLAYLLGAVAATAISFTRPVMGTLLPMMTHDPADLVAATVVTRVIEQVGMLVGPLAGGLLLAIGSPAAVFWTGAVVTGAGAAAVASLRGVHDERRSMPGGRAAVRQLTAGFATVRADRLLVALMLFIVAAGLVRGVGDVVAVMFADERLDGGGGASGILAGLFGVGGLLAATTVSRLVRVRHLARPFLVAGCVAALGSVGLALATGYASATPGFVLLGAGDALLTILAVVTIQRVAPTEVLARVFGIAEATQMGCVALGSAAVSALISTWSLGVAFVVMAAVVGIVVTPAVLSIMRSGRTVEVADEATVTRMLTDPVLAPLPAPVIERLARGAERIHVHGGTDIVTEGEPGDRYYLVVAGEVEVLMAGAHVRVLGPGTSFGEIALLHDVPRTATARATGEVELLAIERDAFLEAVTGHPRSFDVATEVSDRWLAGDRPSAPGPSTRVPSRTGAYTPRVGPSRGPDPGGSMKHHDHLLAVPLFSKFTKQELEHVHSVSTELDIPAGKVLMEEGQIGHEMLVVLDGTLEVRRHGEHIADIGPGGFAGELALLARRPRNSSVIAKTECRVLHIDGRGFTALLEDVPHLAVRMLPIVASRAADD